MIGGCNFIGREKVGPTFFGPDDFENGHDGFENWFIFKIIGFASEFHVFWSTGIASELHQDGFWKPALSGRFRRSGVQAAIARGAHSGVFLGSNLGFATGRRGASGHSARARVSSKCPATDAGVRMHCPRGRAGWIRKCGSFRASPGSIWSQKVVNGAGCLEGVL